MKHLLVCIVLVLSTVSVAIAQSSTGTILGQVKDATGAAIAGSSVTASSAETGLTRTASTEADGSYRFDAMPIGHYDVRAEKEGFKTAIQSGLTLTVAEQAVVNLSLEVGEVRQTVTATAEAPLISTTTSSLGGLVDEQRMADLPLNGRNYNALTLLQPGVSQLISTNTTVLGQSGILFSSNGAPVRSNNYTLDGAILNNYVNTAGGSAMGTTLGVDGIQEYRVITNSFAAEYGLDMGSQMLLVSKGGTNQFHGSAFEYLRNSSLDARNYFDLPPSRLGGHRLPEFRRNNFGGSFGGPIRKDKTFFFAVYEGLRQSLGLTTTNVVPETGCHQAVGVVVTPTICKSVTSNVATTTIMAPFMALYPLPNIGTNQYGFVFQQPTTENYGQIRVDHAFSNNDTFFTRYTIDDSEQTSPYFFPQVTQTLLSRNQFLTLSETHVFSSSMVNSAHFSFSRTNFLLTNITDIPIGPPYSIQAGTTSFYPTGLPIGRLSVGGLAAIGTNSLAPKIGTRNLFGFTDDLSYTKGRHSLKFGVMINHIQDHIHSEGMDKGSISFQNLTSFLAGNFTTLTEIAPANFDRYFHYNTMGFYAQDDWRVTQKLTLNLGLRYEPMTTVNEEHGVQANYRHIFTDTVAQIALGPYFRNPSLQNWGPRLGFAWDIFGDGKTALRGGFGLLYDLATYGSPLNNTAQYSPPFTNLITVNNSNLNTIPYIPVNSQLPGSYRGPVYLMEQPHMLQYNLTVERQLPAGLALTVAYAGSRGINLIQYKEGNPRLPGGIPDANGRCVVAPAGTVIDLTSQISGTATSCWPTANPGVRINPNLPSSQVDPGGGDSFFNALEVGVNKRLAHGLQIQSSYTWSRAIDDTADGQGGDENGSNASAGQDALHQWVERGPSNFDTTHNWRVNGIYHLPTFASNGWQDKLVNGWWGSAIFSLQTGYPFDARLTGNFSNDGLFDAGQDYPNYAPGRNPGNISSGVSSGCTGILPGTPLQTATLWYDPCGFVLPANKLGGIEKGFLGNEGRNVLRGPSLTNLDFSLVKDTSVRALGEAGKIEFRAEVFNIANHTNLQTPITGVQVLSSTNTPLTGAGKITQTIVGPGGTPSSRNIQFGLKLMF